MSNRYNLIDEKWVPIEGGGLYSLKEVFTDTTLTMIGGTPIHKISLLKLFLAIAHSAYTPLDESDWASLGLNGLGKVCVEYLEKHYDQFYLYGVSPFLQMPILESLTDKKGNSIKPVPIGRNYIPDLPSENDTILFESQNERSLSDGDKALFIVSLMNFSLGGKRIAKDVPSLTKGYSKSNSAKSSPSMGNYVGYQHSFLFGSSILETIWLNLYTKDNLLKHPTWGVEPVIPPWEKMPLGEEDDIAKQIKESFMSTLCSMSRFVLLKDDGIIYVEGIQYPSHKNGWTEPFITMNKGGQVIWLEPSKRPWRSLPALLSSAFQSNTSTYNCPQVSLHLGRARGKVDEIGVYSGGLKVRANAGDQSVKQDDDYLESKIILETSVMGESWFLELESEMTLLDNVSKVLWSSVSKYYSLQGSRKSKHSAKATYLFWTECEKLFQILVDSIGDPFKIDILHRRIVAIAIDSYNNYCPKSTAKQIESWAVAFPKYSWYLASTQQTKEALVE